MTKNIALMIVIKEGRAKTECVNVSKDSLDNIVKKNFVQITAMETGYVTMASASAKLDIQVKLVLSIRQRMQYENL